MSDLLERKKRLAKAIQVRKLIDERAIQSDPGAKGRPGGLLRFIEYFWHVLEPNTPLVIDMQMEAICLHLEAVTRGEIKKLIINVSPGAAKSLIVNVFWPAWEWSAAGLPHLRYVTFAYASHLTERDNGRFRDIVMCPEFTELWGKVFYLTEDGKIKPVNNKRGWKFSSSIRGVGTGERGDRVLCLPGSEMILTDAGWLPIGRIVEDRLPVRVAGLDHSSNEIVWQDIERYERNPGNEIVEVTCQTGSFTCTRDHPVFVSGRGYTRADSLRAGESVVWCGSRFPLSSMQGGNQTQAQPAAKVLQQRLPAYMGARVLSNASQQALLRVQDYGVSPPSTYEASKEGRSDFLQPALLQVVECGREQSDVHGGAVDQLPKVRSAIREVAQDTTLLFSTMQRSRDAGAHNRGMEGQSLLSSVRCAVSSQDQNTEILHPSLRRHRPCSQNSREGERPLRSWQRGEAVPARMDAELQGYDPGQRWQPLSDLRCRAGEEATTGCTSRGLCEIQLGAVKPNNSLSLLPWPDARQSKATGGLETQTIRSVEIVGREDVVYNVCVGPCHNYFARGFLTHNCDDLHSVKEAESEAVRSETVRWAREGMSNRLNDMQEGVIVLIGQRVHDEDVSAAMIADKLGYVVLRIPMEYEPAEHCKTAWWEDPRREYGELASPKRFPPMVVSELKRTLGPYAWSSQYQQRPEPRGGGILKRDWWGLYEIKDGQGYRHPFEFRLASLDPAYTARQENDPSGFSVWAVYLDQKRNPKIILLSAWEKWLELHGQDVDKKHMETEGAYIKRAKEKWGLVEWVAYECRRFKVHNLLIENKASGHSVAQEIRRLYADEQWSVRLIDPGAQDKRARAYSIQHLFANGMIQAPGSMVDGKPVFRDFAQFMIDQAAKFRGLPGDEDNALDSLTQALRFLRDTSWAQRTEEVATSLREQMTHKSQRSVIYPV